MLQQRKTYLATSLHEIHLGPNTVLEPSMNLRRQFKSSLKNAFRSLIRPWTLLSPHELSHQALHIKGRQAIISHLVDLQECSLGRHKGTLITQILVLELAIQSLLHRTIHLLIYPYPRAFLRLPGHIINDLEHTTLQGQYLKMHHISSRMPLTVHILTTYYLHQTLH